MLLLVNGGLFSLLSFLFRFKSVEELEEPEEEEVLRSLFFKVNPLES